MTARRVALNAAALEMALWKELYGIELLESVINQNRAHALAFQSAMRIVLNKVRTETSERKFSGKGLLELFLNREETNVLITEEAEVTAKMILSRNI
jgi:hypothetical protein